MAVVHHELRVHGLQALRVADASTMPTVVSGNTNAACIMVGEKCAGPDARGALNAGPGGGNCTLPGLLRSLNVRERHEAAS